MGYNAELHSDCRMSLRYKGDGLERIILPETLALADAAGWSMTTNSESASMNGACPHSFAVRHEFVHDDDQTPAIPPRAMTCPTQADEVNAR